MNMRRKIDVDWRFQLGDVTAAEAREFDASGWRLVNLPHDWSIEGPFSPDHYRQGVYVANHLEGRADGYLPRGVGWYRKELTCGADYAGQRVYLEFEGVFRNSTVWLNGRQVGRHASGYTGVVYDLTPHLDFSVQPNCLAVRVDARETEGWWYEGAGIYRHVWLMAAPPLHIMPWGIAITTPQVNYSSATVQTRVAVVNSHPGRQEFLVRNSIYDQAGNRLVEMETGGRLDANQQQDYIQEIELIQPHLWSPDDPHLYRLRTEVTTPDGACDSRETRFGARWFEFTSDQGFLLNGKPLQLRGGCLHHDYGGLGVALPDRAHEKNVEVLKAMGSNIIRSSHNAAAPALMDACDRLGMLFWAETRYLDVQTGARENLKALIRRDRNHPCIILWSLANTAGSPDGQLTQYLKQLHADTKALDPSRPTAVALEGNADANGNGFALITDVVGYNGGGIGIDDRDHLMFPNRKILISEFSSGRGARGVYQESQVVTDELETFGDGRVMKRGGHLCSSYDLCLGHEKDWRHIAGRPWLAGGIMWSAIEYRGETSGWPIVTSQFGALDICRFPKDVYYFYQKEWTAKPMLHLFPHWTWPGKEGQPIDIWCYSNCDTVDLFLNGKPQQGIPHFLQYRAAWPHLYWQVPYGPGLVRAEGRVAGRLVCWQEIKTAGAATSIRLAPDRSQLTADGEDVSFITVSIHDADGTVAPLADHAITVSVKGAGRLIGLSAGNPGSHESEKGACIKVFNGYGLAIVQSLPQPGAIEVGVESPGLAPATAHIQCMAR